MLSINNIRAGYKTAQGLVTAVDNVSFDICDNEVLGIAGESGCGKSTLIKVIYGYVMPPMQILSGVVEMRTFNESGKPVTLRGDDIRNAWWKDISYVPQGSMSVLNPVTKIEAQFLDAVTKAHNAGRKAQIKESIIGYLRELDLPPTVLNAYPHQLSGGMRQRVIIALATFLHPTVVLADEPTTALDVVVQRSILGMLIQMQRRMKNTLVIVSHDMGVHYQITHRLAIMYAGKLVELGPTEAIFRRPLHPYTELLIKSLPQIGDQTQRQGISGRPPSLLDPPLGCRFHGRCPAAMDICEALEPRLVEVEQGHYVACHLRTPSVVSHQP